MKARWSHPGQNLLLLFGSLICFGIAAELAVRAMGLANHLLTDPAFEPGRWGEAPYRYRANFVGTVQAQTHLRTNSLGCRDREYAYLKPHDTLRVVVMGDSCTFGVGVDQDKVFSKILERNLSERLHPHTVEVINFGVQGYSIRHMVDRYSQDARQLSPDVAVLAFIASDLALMREDNFVDSEGYLTKKLGGGNSLKHYLRKSQLMYLIKEAFLTQFYFNTKEYQDRNLTKRTLDRRLGVFETDVTRFLETCSSDGVIPLAALLSLPKTEFDVAIMAKLQRSFPNMTVVDCTPSLGDPCVRELQISPRDGHPNAKAHELIAKKLEPVLVQTLSDKSRCEAR